VNFDAPGRFGNGAVWIAAGAFLKFGVATAAEGPTTSRVALTVPSETN
jgi:hypothetical protein